MGSLRTCPTSTVGISHFQGLCTGEPISFPADHFETFLSPRHQYTTSFLLPSWTGFKTTTQCSSLSHPDAQEILEKLQWLLKPQPSTCLLALKISKAWIIHQSTYLPTSREQKPNPHRSPIEGSFLWLEIISFVQLFLLKLCF